MTLFKTYRNSILIKDHLSCKHIQAGEYSYYAGYYHEKSFEECVMYLDSLDNAADSSQIDQLIIGKFCSIASGVKFMMGGNQGHNHHWIANYPLDAFDEDFDGYQCVSPKAHLWKGNTVVGNDVWIGAEALIMPGLTLGDGAVIATRSHLTKNVSPYEVWGGNPARLIKKRFSEEEIQILLEIKWWDWDRKTLKQYLPWLRSADIHGLWQAIKSSQ